MLSRFLVIRYYLRVHTMRIFTILGFCCLFAFILLSPVWQTVFHQPPNTVNMYVGHYFEDYYEYLSFIRQGQKGHLILQNLFTTDDPSHFFIGWWPFSLLGYLGFLIHVPLAPMHLYWLSSFVFCVAFTVLTFKAVSLLAGQDSFIRKLSVLLLICFSCSFFSVSLQNRIGIAPIDFWWSIGSPFARYNIGTPQHQLTQIVLLSALLLFCTVSLDRLFHQSLILTVSSLLLLSLSPSHLILMWMTIFSARIFMLLIKQGFNLKKMALLCLPFIISFAVVAPLALYIFGQYQSIPTLISSREWEMKSLYYPSLVQLVLSLGPLAILALFGLPYYFRRMSFPRLVFFFLAFYSFFAVLVPLSYQSGNILRFLGVHNLRFYTAGSYVFLGISCLGLLKTIFRQKKVYYIAVFLLLIFFLPSFYFYWQKISSNPYAASFLQYLPKDTYYGLHFFDKYPQTDTILASPSSWLGLVVPSAIGKRVYYGRSIFTLDTQNKKKKADDFYRGKINSAQAQNFLDQEKISFILLTPADGTREQFGQLYPFITPVYQNSAITIYTHQKP